MENTSRTEVNTRDVYYYRQRFKNRVFSKVAEFFVKEAERTGVTKRDIAIRLNKDPSQITRWLAEPSNLTLETISDLLLAMDAEAEPPRIVRFADRPALNYVHPLIARVQGRIPAAPQPIKPLPDPVGFSTATPTTSNATSQVVEFVS
jgi:hypothetical protein